MKKNKINEAVDNLNRKILSLSNTQTEIKNSITKLTSLNDDVKKIKKVIEKEFAGASFKEMLDNKIQESNVDLNRKIIAIMNTQLEMNNSLIKIEKINDEFNKVKQLIGTQLGGKNLLDISNVKIKGETDILNRKIDALGNSRNELHNLMGTFENLVTSTTPTSTTTNS